MSEESELGFSEAWTAKEGSGGEGGPVSREAGRVARPKGCLTYIPASVRGLVLGAPRSDSGLETRTRSPQEHE